MLFVVDVYDVERIIRLDGVVDEDGDEDEDVALSHSVIYSESMPSCLNVHVVLS